MPTAIMATLVVGLTTGATLYRHAVTASMPGAGQQATARTLAVQDWLSLATIGTIIAYAGLVIYPLGSRLRAERQRQNRLTDEVAERNVDLELMSRLAKIGVWSVDLRSQEIYWSPETRRIHEVSDDYQPVFDQAVQFYPETIREVLSEGLERAISTGEPWDGELPFITAKGNHRWVRVYAVAIEEDGNVTKLIGAFQDTTDMVRERDDVRIAKQRLELATESAAIGLWDWDVAEDRFWTAPRWWSYLGFETARDAVPDMIADQTIHPDDLPRVVANRQAFFAEKKPELINEFRHIDGAGQWRWISSMGRATGWDADGRVTRVSGVYVDIHERKVSAERIAYAAHHDVMTGLANRQRFKRTISEALRGQQNGDTAMLAVMLIDLDRFKAVNDTFGHAAGDAVLTGVADRLRAIVRETDLVARLGGDEFAILLRDSDRIREHAAAVSARILAAISEPFAFEGTPLQIGVSLGIAIGPEHGDTVDALVRNADAALYKVKINGKNGFRFFDSELAAEADARRELEADLREAVGRNQLELHYQPEIDLRTGTIVAYEALLRWHHPTRGIVSPDLFMQIAEDTGLIVPIGKWVIERACRDAALWPNKAVVAVNLSVTQIGKSNLVDIVTAALLRSGLPAQRLELEVTENLFLRRDSGCLSDLHQLNELGVRLALDDFGTGSSSLGSLQRLPFQKIKIDRLFVADIASNAQSAAIVCAIANLARTLDIETVAEGIETDDQARLLSAAGCSLGQGYLFGRPAPARQIGSAETTARHDETVRESMVA